MFPTDKGESVSEYVSRIIDMIRESGFDYQLTPMGSIVEAGSLEPLLELVGKAYRLIGEDSNRVYSAIKLDIRKGKSGRMHAKVASVEEKIGKVNK